MTSRFGSAQRSSTARSATPRSRPSGVIGSSWRTRSLIRTLCSAPAWVSRSRGPHPPIQRRPLGAGQLERHAARPGRTTAAGPTCRRRCRWSWCAATRTGADPPPWPTTPDARHAHGRRRTPRSATTPAPSAPSPPPTGSPPAPPANAAVSISVRLSTVGHALRLAIVLPVSSRTRTVCALAMPKSIPTRRLHFISSPVVVSVPPARPQERRTIRPRSQGRHAQPRLPLMCCNRLRPRRAEPLPSSGASVASRVWQSVERGQTPTRDLPQNHLDATPRTSREDHATLGPQPRVDQRYRCPLHEPTWGLRPHARFARSPSPLGSLAVARSASSCCATPDRCRRRDSNSH